MASQAKGFFPPHQDPLSQLLGSTILPPPPPPQLLTQPELSEVGWNLCSGGVCVCVCVCVRERERERERKREREKWGRTVIIREGGGEEAKENCEGVSKLKRSKDSQ
jgi:hypothetical protein|uniref:Uncharacterized protein n=1 Tax=Mus musculus TaxID=10090 RepID=Q8CAQ2_MOUSE|nr:unnamed protein product [Mus musculus]